MEMSYIFLFIVIFIFFEMICIVLSTNLSNNNLPIVINTWAFTNATAAAWKTLTDSQHSALDALVEGCSTCEREQCDGTVGYGGSPDENGETTLDAMIMDGSDMNMGAVANLRNIKNAISVARHVLKNTRHSLLVGDQATNFAIQMGFKKENLSTERSIEIWKKWTLKNCQPNFWKNVSPDPKKSCGPYKATETCTKMYTSECDDPELFGKYNHDTISMIVIDENGKIFAGTSTNGATHKIPGRVGDSPIPGAGVYANNDYGAAGATGDGDIMMRFLPSFEAVQYLKAGLTPKEAAKKSIQSIIRYHPKFFGGIIVVNKYGEYSAACTGMKKFPFSIYKSNYVDAQVEYVDCINVEKEEI